MSTPKIRDTTYSQTYPPHIKHIQCVNHQSCKVFVQRKSIDSMSFKLSSLFVCSSVFVPWHAIKYPNECLFIRELCCPIYSVSFSDETTKHVCRLHQKRKPRIRKQFYPFIAYTGYAYHMHNSPRRGYSHFKEIPE